MTPPRPSGPNTAGWIAAGLGSFVLGASCLVAWHAEWENEKALAEPVETRFIQDRPEPNYVTSKPTVEKPPKPDPIPPGLVPDGEFDGERKSLMEACDAGEFGDAMSRIRSMERRWPGRKALLQEHRREVESLVEAALEEALERLESDPERGLEAARELERRLPAEAAKRLRESMDASPAATETGRMRLKEAEDEARAGRWLEAAVGAHEAADLMRGEEASAARARAGSWLRRARYQGVVAPAALDAVEDAKLAAIEKTIDSTLGGWPPVDAEKALEGAPADLVAACILRGGSPMDSLSGTHVFEHDTKSGKRTYAVSIPVHNTPARPLPLIVTLIPGGGPDIARAAASGRRAALSDRAIVAALVPDSGEGWGPNRAGEEHVPAMLRDLRTRVIFDPDRVVLTGSSAGAHGVWFQALRYGDRYAAYVPVSGTPYTPLYGVHWLQWMENLTHAPARCLQGAKDDMFAASTARSFYERARTRTLRVEYIEDPKAAHEGATVEAQVEALEWAIAQTRDAAPRKLGWTSDHLHTGRFSWIEMTALSSKGGVAKLSFVDDFGKTVEQREILREVARVDAEAKGQTIEVAAVQVEKLRVYWSDRVVDLSKPVTIRVNGKEAWKGVPEISTAFMIEEARRTGRRDRVFAGSVEIEVP